MKAQPAVVKGVLNPVERLSEVLFGLIMSLSFTLTLSVISGGREEVRTMILSVLGCNIAWGIIDAVLYLLGVVGERGRMSALRASIRDTGDNEQARLAVAETLPPEVAGALSPSDLDRIRSRLLDQAGELPGPRISLGDVRGALGVFVLVVLSCIPIVVPFLLMSDPIPALRTSNAIAVVMMFFCGATLARYAGLNMFWTGLAMVVLGVVMVGITIALGG